MIIKFRVRKRLMTALVNEEALIERRYVDAHPALVDVLKDQALIKTLVLEQAARSRKWSWIIFLMSPLAWLAGASASHSGQ